MCSPSQSWPRHPGWAQTDHAAPQPATPAPTHDHSAPSGAAPGATHEGMSHGGDSPAEMLWSMYTDLGNRAYQHGLYGEAEKRFKSALKEARAFGPTDRRLALSLNNLAEAYRMEGRFTDSEQSAREVLALREGAFGPTNVSVGDSLNTLALARQAQSHPDEAETLYRRALAI
jgi:Tetratricopeptide repeat